MSNKSPIAWGAALRDLRADREARPEVREERLQTTAHVRGGQVLSCWRGRSGKRYVVAVSDISAFTPEPAGAAYLAVTRDERGEGILLTAAAFEAGASLSAWLASVKLRGAERRAAVADLAPAVSRARAA